MSLLPAAGVQLSGVLAVEYKWLSTQHFACCRQPHGQQRHCIFAPPCCWICCTQLASERVMHCAGVHAGRRAAESVLGAPKPRETTQAASRPRARPRRAGQLLGAGGQRPNRETRPLYKKVRRGQSATISRSGRGQQTRYGATTMNIRRHHRSTARTQGRAIGHRSGGEHFRSVRAREGKWIAGTNYTSARGAERRPSHTCTTTGNRRHQMSWANNSNDSLRQPHKRLIRDGWCTSPRLKTQHTRTHTPLKRGLRGS